MNEKQKERIARLGLKESEFLPDEFGKAEIIEMLAEQEFHICLLELGVNPDDL